MHSDGFSDGDVINSCLCLSREDTNGWGGPSPVCKSAHTFWVDLVSSCSVCLSWSPEMCSAKEEMILLDSLFSLLDLTRIDILLNEEQKAGDGTPGIRNSRLFQEDCSGLLCGCTSFPLHLPIPLCSLLTPTCTAEQSSTPCCDFPGKMLSCEILGESYHMDLSESIARALPNRPADRGTLRSPSSKS